MEARLQHQQHLAPHVVARGVGDDDRPPLHDARARGIVFDLDLEDRIERGIGREHELDQHLLPRIIAIGPLVEGLLYPSRGLFERREIGGGIDEARLPLGPGVPFALAHVLQTAPHGRTVEQRLDTGGVAAADQAQFPMASLRRREEGAPGDAIAFVFQQRSLDGGGRGECGRDRDGNDGQQRKFRHTGTG